jgi:hypothetical protein
MSVNPCFSQIIGYSRKEDSCILESWDAAYSLSDSGLYIDELPGMPQRFISSLGGNYDIWEKFDNAYENAINAFKIDLLSELFKYKEPAHKKFIGDIGYKSFTTSHVDKDYWGIRMYSDIIGGAYILRGVTMLLNVTETVTINIYDDYDLLYTIYADAVANKPRYTAITPVSLPLDGNYYFIYQSTGQPLNNKLTCNCGSYKWCFNTETPCYKVSRDRWTEWAMVAGIWGSDVNDRDDWATSRESYGMVLHGDFTCDILGTLCTDHSDWTGNEIDFAIANAIWYKTGEFLATYIMDTEEVSRRTLLGVEQWNANRQYYNARYIAMINFIAENFEDDRNECLRCRQPLGHNVRSQFL